jgi:hypothetical protein
VSPSTARAWAMRAFSSRMRASSAGSGVTIASGRPSTRWTSKRLGATASVRVSLRPSGQTMSSVARGPASRPKAMGKRPSAETRKARPSNVACAPGAARTTAKPPWTSCPLISISAARAGSRQATAARAARLSQQRALLGRVPARAARLAPPVTLAATSPSAKRKLTSPAWRASAAWVTTAPCASVTSAKPRANVFL